MPDLRYHAAGLHLKDHVAIAAGWGFRSIQQEHGLHTSRLPCCPKHTPNLHFDACGSVIRKRLVGAQILHFLNRTAGPLDSRLAITDSSETKVRIGCQDDSPPTWSWLDCVRPDGETRQPWSRWHRDYSPCLSAGVETSAGSSEAFRSTHRVIQTRYHSIDPAIVIKVSEGAAAMGIAPKPGPEPLRASATHAPGWRTNGCQYDRLPKVDVIHHHRICGPMSPSPSLFRSKMPIPIRPRAEQQRQSARIGRVPQKPPRFWKSGRSRWKVR